MPAATQPTKPTDRSRDIRDLDPEAFFGPLAHGGGELPSEPRDIRDLDPEAFFGPLAHGGGELPPAIGVLRPGDPMQRELVEAFGPHAGSRPAAVPAALSTGEPGPQMFRIGTQIMQPAARTDADRQAWEAVRAGASAPSIPAPPPKGYKDPRGPVGFVEQITTLDQSQVPFYGMMADAAESIDLLMAARRVESGEASANDIATVSAALAEQYEGQVRGRTFGGSVAAIARHVPTFVTEMATTGGLTAAGRGAVGRVAEGAGVKGAREIVERAVTEAAAKGASKSAARRAGEAALRGTAVAGGELTRLPAFAPAIAQGVARRQMPQVWRGEDGGIETSPSDQDFMESLYKATGEQYVESLSEQTGGLLSKAAGAIPGAGKVRALKAAIATRWTRMVPNRTAQDLVDKVAKDAGWHGVIGEVFEERVGEAMRAGLGVEDYTPPTPEQLSHEVAAFALVGGGSRAAATAIDAGAVAASAAASRVGRRVQGKGEGPPQASPAGGAGAEVSDPPPPLDRAPQVPQPPRVNRAVDWPERPAVSRPPAQGRVGRLRLADGGERAIRYDVIDAADLITTHRPLDGFQPDPSGDLNERAYHDPTEGAASRETVKRIAANLDPDLLLTNSPTAVDGPPVVTGDYRVLGGNARSMALKIAYSRGNEGATRYIDALMRELPGYGLSARDIRGMAHPVLVRRLEGDAGKRGELSRALNEAMTTGKTADTDAVSRGLLLEQSHTDEIAALLGEDTLRDALGDPRRAAEIIRVMVDSGAFSPSDLVQHRRSDGTLEDTGKSAIERAVLGAAVGDVRTLAQTSPGVRQKLVRALSPITRLRRSRTAETSGGLDFVGTLSRALDALYELRESQARSMQDLVSQQSMVAEPWRSDPRAIALATALDTDTPTRFAGRLRDVASVAETVGGGQEGFNFGQPRSPLDAFDEVFGVGGAPSSGALESGAPSGDSVGQGGLFGQGVVSSDIGRQKDLFGDISRSKNDPMARKAGESDADYRMRIRFADAAENTGRLFESGAPARRQGEVRITGSEFGGREVGDSELRRRARAHAMHVLRNGGPFRNTETGRDIRISRAGTNKIIANTADIRRAMAVEHIPEIIRDGRLVDSRPPEEPGDQVRGYHYFETPATIEGKSGSVRFTVREEANGNWYYNHDIAVKSDNPPENQVLQTPSGPVSGPAVGGSSDQSIGEGDADVKAESGARRKRSGPAPASPAQAAPAPRGANSGKKHGTGTAPPAKRTVAQGPGNAPRDVRRDVISMREARRRMLNAGKSASGSGALDGEVLNWRAIIDELAGALNLRPPGIGRNSKLRTVWLGLYRFIRQDIRQRSPSDTQTYAHEVGHYLHELLFPGVRERLLAPKGSPARQSIGGLFPASWQQELHALGVALYGKTMPNVGGYATEGWAEAVRMVMTDPAQLKKKAPTVYREAVGMLVREHPDVWAALTRFRLRLAVLKDADDPMAAIMSRSPERPERIADRVSDVLIDWVDRTQRALDFITDLSLKDLPADKNPHLAALRNDGYISGDLRTIVDLGPWDVTDPTHVRRANPSKADADGTVTIDTSRTIPSLQEILTPVRPMLELWKEYMVAKRIREKRGQGFGGAGGRLSDEDVDRVIALGEERPEIVEAARQFQELNEWLVRDYAVHHGLISPESAEQIIAKNQHYITFRYEDPFEDGPKSRVRGKGGTFGNQSRPFTYFKTGSDYPQLDPLGAFLSNVAGIVKKAHANKTAALFARHADIATPGIGRWLSRVDQPQQAWKARSSQLASKVRRQLAGTIADMGDLYGDDAAEKLSEAIDGMTGETFFEAKWNEPDPRKRIIMVLVGGKRQYYEVKDRRLWNLLTNSTTGVASLQVPRIMTAAAELLRAGATSRNPLFFIPNALRDTTQALVMTESELTNLPRQVRSRLEAVRAAFLGGDLERMFLASGADMSHSQGDYFDPETLVADERAMFRRSPFRAKWAPGRRGRAAAETAIDAVTLRHLASLNDRIERMTRYAEFAAVLKGRTDASSVAQAGQAAADVTVDFTRGGLLSKKASQVIPFFNAAVQGTDKLGRFIRKNPLRALASIFSFIVLPTLLQLWMNDDNEDYWAKPAGQRDRFWYFPVRRAEGGAMVYLRLPKPPGLGVFALAMERTWGRARGINPTSGERGDPLAFKGAIKSALEQLTPGISVAMLRPLIEVGANYDFFRDRPIVDQWEQALPAEEQGADRSSEFARIVGRIFDVPPAATDHLIAGYTAGLGKAGLQLADPVLRTVAPEGTTPPREPMRFDDYLLVKNFLAGTTRREHEALRRFYDEWDEVRAVRRRLAQLEVDPAREAAYRESHLPELKKYRVLSSAAERIGRLGKRRRAILAAPRNDPMELDRALRENLDAMIETARAAYGAMPGDAE